MKPYIQRLFDELEAEGLIMRDGRMRPGRTGGPQPVYRLTPKGEAIAEDVLPLVKDRMNRFIAEVRHGVALFFNRTTDLADGWWWGSDVDPLQHGPFASSADALADARRGAEGFELVIWDRAELRRPDRPLGLTGHVVLIDTGGRLWGKKGERPVRGWSPLQ